VNPTFLQRSTILSKRGLLFYTMGRASNAIDDFDTVLSIPGTSAGIRAMALYHKGISLQMEGRLLDAITTLTDALDDDDMHLACYRSVRIEPLST
jgi:tetratricopeptide (TPR) repeat protein